MSDTRKCPQCGQIKPIEDFGYTMQRRHNKTYGPYVRTYCKPCSNERIAAYRVENPRRSRKSSVSRRFVTEHSRVMLAELADGRWHDLQKIIDLGSRTIAPGVAFRRGEYMRARKRNKGLGPRIRGDDSDSIVTGARSVARQALAAHVRNGKLERKGDLIRIARQKDAG